jgi:hypothetical protein
LQEDEIFWMGGQRGSPDEKTQLADDGDFVDSIEAACRSAGAEVSRFVSAQGSYGTWLVEFRLGGQSQRLVWNGKEQKLVLQVERERGGWDEPQETSVVVMDAGGFIAAVHQLLDHPDSNLS